MLDKKESQNINRSALLTALHYKLLYIINCTKKYKNHGLYNGACMVYIRKTLLTQSAILYNCISGWLCTRPRKTTNKTTTEC